MIKFLRHYSCFCLVWHLSGAFCSEKQRLQESGTAANKSWASTIGTNYVKQTCRDSDCLKFKLNKEIIKRYVQGQLLRLEQHVLLTLRTSLSPCLGLLAFLGKTINLLLYSLSLWTLAWRDSADLFFLLWSTEIPIVGATFREMPAA